MTIGIVIVFYTIKNNQGKKEKIKKLFIEPDVHQTKRNIILTGDYDKVIEMSEKINWRKFLANFILDTLSFETSSLFDDKSISEFQRKILPAVNLEDATKHFKFPPQHPQNGVAYACCGIDDKYYYPLANFHEYVNEKKQSAFIELCSSLNASEIILTSYEENGKKFEGSAMIKKIPSKVGFIDISKNLDYKNTSSKQELVFYKFNQPKKNIYFYDNPWIESVPSWDTLRKIRLENSLDLYQTQLDFTDDMGVNANIISKLDKTDISIGGNYNKMKKRKYNLKVTFW